MKLGAPPVHVRIALGILLVGSLSYLARGTDPEAFRWLSAAGAGAVARGLHDLRVLVSGALQLPGWFLGGFADFTYAFALGAWFARAPFRTRSLAFVFALGHELLQGAHLVPGTFDPWDVVVLTTGFLLASVTLERARQGTPWRGLLPIAWGPRECHPGSPRVRPPVR